MRRASKLAGVMACITAIAVMSGGHWFILQTIAWGRMIVNFSQRDAFGTAVTKTFSGKHPCAMCLKIRKDWHEEKQREEKAPWVKTEKQPELLWEFRRLIVPDPPTLAWDPQPYAPEAHPDFIDSPPTPPPRSPSHVL